MIRYALVFLLLALVSAIFGFTLLEGFALEAAKIVFFVFIGLFVVTLFVGSQDLRPRL